MSYKIYRCPGCYRVDYQVGCCSKECQKKAEENFKKQEEEMRKMWFKK